MMSRIRDLYTAAMRGEASAAEQDELMQLLAQTDQAAEARQLIREAIKEGYATGQPMPDDRLLEIRQAITGVPKKKSAPVHFLRRWRWAVAAAVLLLGVGAYLWTSDKKAAPPAITKLSPGDVHPGDIAPGKKGAVLTLADGSQVVLDSLENGLITTQNGVRVQLTNGQVAYDRKQKTAGKIAYNTLTTPRGRHFQVILTDGTKVWLNAASSLRYPAAFTEKERRVEVTGEAFFEVAENPEMPFRVNVDNKAEITVLGTRFNVNAYENENTVNTTLLEGSVKVSALSGQQPAHAIRSAVLHPGQQAQVGQQGLKVVDDADIDKTIAWKQGLFNFNGVTLREAMQQLERWYDIEVVYEKGVPDIIFSGKMTKGVSLKGLLVALEKAEVHFRLEGRKLIVLP